MPEKILMPISTFFALGGEPLVVLTKENHCAFCGAEGERVEDPYGWKHPQPVCKPFSEGLQYAEKAGIDVTPERDGWFVAATEDTDEQG